MPGNVIIIIIIQFKKEGDSMNKRKRINIIVTKIYTYCKSSARWKEEYWIS